MADYTVSWAAFSGDPIYGELPVSSFSYSDTLNSPGSITGTIPLNPYPGLAGTPFSLDTFLEGNTSLWVARNGVPVWFGHLWSWDIDAGADQLTFTGEGPHSYLRRRVTGGGSTVFSADQATIVNTIIQLATDSSYHPYTGLTINTSATGVTREIWYPWWEFVTVADAIDKLAAMDNGFDFRWRPYADTSGVWGVAFDLQYPAGGTDTELVFELGSNIAALRMVSDGKSLANQLFCTGSGTGAETLVAQPIVNELITLGWPALDTVTDYPDVVETVLLQALADRDARRLRVPIRQLNLEVFADTTPTVTDYGVGDIVHVNADRGILQLVDALYRVTVKTVSVDEGGNEQVQLSLAPGGMF